MTWRRTALRAAILIAAGSLLLWLAHEIGRPPLDLTPSIVLGGVLLALSLIDLETGLLPNWLTLPLIALGGLYTWQSGGDVLMSGLGAGVGYALIWGLAMYWLKARGRQGIGLGDAKLLAAGGAWLGVVALPGILLIASGSALLFVGGQALQKKSQVNLATSIRFGPFLAIGIWTMWCFRPY